MRIVTFIKPLFAICVASSIIITGCKKSNNSSPTTAGDDSTAANMSGTAATADNAYNDVLQIALEGGLDNNIAYIASQASRGNVTTNGVHQAYSVNGINSLSCATYTLTPADTSTFPKTLVVDFGTGCTSNDGITRKGKITYILTGKVLLPGTTISATFESYSVNNYQLEGTYSITNNSTLAGISFTTKVTSGKITFPDATFYNYAGDKTIKMTAGMSTPTDPSDDVYSITGSNSISSSAGNSLVANITTVLSKSYTCKHVSSGIVSFIYNNNIHGTLDFGNGTCDDQATIKVGTFTKNITLN